MRPTESGDMSFPHHSAIHSAIDWEKRRYEIAKAVLSNPQMIESTQRTVGSYTYTVNDIDKTIDKAVAIADKLIEKLKGGEE